jgi:hypothetical protein
MTLRVRELIKANWITSLFAAKKNLQLHNVGMMGGGELCGFRFWVIGFRF